MTSKGAVVTFGMSASNKLFINSSTFTKTKHDV